MKGSGRPGQSPAGRGVAQRLERARDYGPSARDANLHDGPRLHLRDPPATLAVAVEPRRAEGAHLPSSELRAGDDEHDLSAREPTDVLDLDLELPLAGLRP
jgi:hypothetical protein